MPDMMRAGPEGDARAPAPSQPEGFSTPIVLKHGIAALAPVPVAQGAFGKVYLGKILNPLGLLAERVVWGEESPRWLGLPDVPYSETAPGGERAPAPILDPTLRERVYGTATRLWKEYRERRTEDPARADEEFKDWLGLIDPLLLEDRTIAVKVLQPPRASDSSDGGALADEVLRRFLKENDLLRRLDHPGVVRRFGLLRDREVGWCILLEYIEGATLEEHLKKFEGRRMPIPDATRVVDELARAVDYIHSRGIVHRDLKPQNVMIRHPSAEAVITDFGIGKRLSESPAQQLTLVGVRLGTPRYMAPEQAAEEGKSTAQTDVYQLATLLFEMVTGHGAYEGMEAEEVFSWLGDPSRRHPTTVLDHIPGISQELEALIEVGREKDPQSRWTLAEFRSKLAELRHGGHFEKRRTRKLASSAEVGRALAEARTRRKECLWKEHVIERELAQAEVLERAEQVRGHLQASDWKKARTELGRLQAAYGTGRAPAPRLAAEMDALEKALRFGTARDEAAALLSRAEEGFAAGRYSDVGAALAELSPKMAALPRRSCSELHERQKKLSRLYDANHRSLVELLAALRGAFVDKIRAEYHRLHERYGAGGRIEGPGIEDALKKVEAAWNNLRTIDPDKVGREAYAAVERELAEQKIALGDLGKRVRASEAVPPESP